MTTGRCTKRRFRNRIAAMLALAKIQARDNTTRPSTETRVYHCPLCGGWHLTSQTRRDN